MNQEKFVYVIYIGAPQEKVWNALLDAEMTHQYWGHANVSDWKPGSRWDHKAADVAGTVHVTGEVVEFTPPKRLVMTWAYPADAADRSKHTRVTIELEPTGDKTRLSVTHDEFSGGDMFGKISNGWPRVLSSLKSFLETGHPLKTWD